MSDKSVTVQYFAWFRESAGRESEQVATGALTAAELFAELAPHRGLGERPPLALVAINDTMSDWETALDDGDRVLFFPPVAGG